MSDRGKQIGQMLGHYQLMTISHVSIGYINNMAEGWDLVFY